MLLQRRAQSGELNTPQRMQYLIDVVRAVKQRTQALDAQQRSLDPANLPKDTTGLGLCVALSGVVWLWWGGGNRAAHCAAAAGGALVNAACLITRSNLRSALVALSQWGSCAVSSTSS
jgi:hypothetical protein